MIADADLSPCTENIEGLLARNALTSLQFNDTSHKHVVCSTTAVSLAHLFAENPQLTRVHTWDLGDVYPSMLMNELSELSELLKSNRHIQILSFKSDGKPHGVIDCSGADPEHPLHSFFNFLCSNQTIRTLILDNCKIDDKVLKQLCDCLLKNRSLQNLSLQFAEFLCLRPLVELLSNNTPLQNLDIFSLPDGIDVNEWIEFAGCLKFNCNLNHLDLSNCGLSDKTIVALSQTLHSNTSLRILTIINNSFGKAGGKAIVEMLKVNKSLTTLNLSDNDLKSEWLENFAHSMEQNHTLLNLELSSNKINRKGASFVAEGLMVNRCLSILNIAHNDIGNEGIKVIFNALQENSNSKLHEMDVSSNSLSNQGAIFLAQILSLDHCCLKSLNVRWNHFQLSSGQSV
jgi:Ran GTPase-activating protein (RanGAP) involved in mRNA processing and transport